MDIVWFVLVGVFAGWLAGLYAKGKGFGLLGDLVVGIIGSLVGGFLFGLLGFKAYTLLGSLITAFIGAVVFLSVLHILKKL